MLFKFFSALHDDDSLEHWFSQKFSPLLFLMDWSKFMSLLEKKPLLSSLCDLSHFVYSSKNCCFHIKQRQFACLRQFHELAVQNRVRDKPFIRDAHILILAKKKRALWYFSRLRDCAFVSSDRFWRKKNLEVNWILLK